MGFLDSLKGISQEPENKFHVFMGLPGSGKTTIAGTYPKPMLYISIGDDGGGIVLKNYSDTDIQTIKMEDDPLTMTGGKGLALKLEDLLVEIKQAMDKGTFNFKTIVIDAYSSIEESMVARAVKVKKGAALNFDERASIGQKMVSLRDLLVDISRKGPTIVALSHVKSTEITDTSSGTKEMKIIPKMTQNNGNILLERANIVIYACRKTVVEDDGSRVVKFLAYVGPNPSMDTKYRVAGGKFAKGVYIEDCNYDKLMNLQSADIEKIEQPKVVEEESKNPFEENKDEKENW